MKLHHVGFLVESIDEYERNIIYDEKIGDVVDAIQKARLSLYKVNDSSFIELIQPLSEDSYTWKQLKVKRNHYHHLCYETEKDKLQLIIKTYNLVHVNGPMKAILFKDLLVDFYFTRNKELVEFIIK
jgi:hypothetical protein